jgi:hypothetical protein
MAIGFGWLFRDFRAWMLRLAVYDLIVTPAWTSLLAARRPPAAAPEGVRFQTSRYSPPPSRGGRW